MIHKVDIIAAIVSVVTGTSTFMAPKSRVIAIYLLFVGAFLLVFKEGVLAEGTKELELELELAKSELKLEQL